MEPGNTLPRDFDLSAVDWASMDFRGGIEIHQQLDTRKLFCECQPRIRSDEPALITRRKLHAVASEMGEYDPAALHEVHRDRTFWYESYPETVCLVELDEEPPHPVNRVALEIVLQTGLLLDARPVDEIQVMRKTVIDGSNTAGFQRTMLVATDGRLETAEGEVYLQYFCLEEDAARIIETNEREVRYRLDRLGIPLLEIVTGPAFVSPMQGGEVADRLGHIIRSLRVRRGIGSIRQDVNVSTKYGTRIEIKGVQRHRMVPTIMAYEALRQRSLHEIAEGLQQRRAPMTLEELRGATRDVTDRFAETAVRSLRRTLDAGGRITAIRAPGFEGLLGTELCPGKRLGTELKDQVLTLGIRGILHSDEDLGAAGMTAAEIQGMREVLGAPEGEAFLLFAAFPAVIEKALDKLHGRLVAAFEGVPGESRRALKDGNSQYMRPLPGEARMYPETDIPPVPQTPDHIAGVRAALPEIAEERVQRLSEAWQLDAHDLRLAEDYLPMLERVVSGTGLDVPFAFNVVASNLVDTRRRTGMSLAADLVAEVLTAVSEGRLVRGALPLVLDRLAGGEPLPEILAELAPDTVALDEVIGETISEHSDLLEHPKRFEILMGALMAKARGHVVGAEAARRLARRLEEQTVSHA